MALVKRPLARASLSDSLRVGEETFARCDRALVFDDERALVGFFGRDLRATVRGRGLVDACWAGRFASDFAGDGGDDGAVDELACV